MGGGGGFKGPGGKGGKKFPFGKAKKNLTNSTNSLPLLTGIVT